MLLATVLFVIAILHTFLVGYIARAADRFPEGSVLENLLHLLSEIEVVFGFWGAVSIAALAVMTSPSEAVEYLESRNYTEPLFVFVIMVVCATAPILTLAERTMDTLMAASVRLLKLRGYRHDEPIRDLVMFVIVMSVGPLLGSLITEPAAMTVCALILRDRFYRRTVNTKFKYAMTGLLFVNISIGGTLTSFAAPPVLMVANAWGWDTTFMLQFFGWKAVLACFVSAGLTAYSYRRSLMTLTLAQQRRASTSPWWLILIHVAFVALIVMSAHHSVVFVGLFLLFLGVATVTKEYQDDLKLREGLLVAFFLGGLVVLGGPQGWWISPLLLKFEGFVLFAGAAALTAFTDNAAITYLGSLVPDLADAAKYALVAGAVTGGGLTVIANAPNPAGHGILNPSFGKSGMNPILLLRAALIPTVIAAVVFWLL